MVLSEILQGFARYLEQKNLDEENKYQIPKSSDDISIFKHSDEFKEYLSHKLNIFESIKLMSITKLLSAEFLEGIFNDEEEALNNAEDTEKIENTTEEAMSEEETQDDSDIITDVLNNLFQDEEIITSLDENSDSILDKDEITTFLNSINEYDEDLENLSIEDILAGVEKLKEDRKETVPEEETQEIKEAPQVQSSTSTPSRHSSGSSNSSSGSSRNYSNTYQQNNNSAAKSYENMTKEELNKELSIAQNEVNEKQKILSSIYDGSESSISQKNENVEKLYNEYLNQLEEVDVDMAQKADSKEQEIKIKENEINLKNQEISNQESAVLNSQTAYENAKSTTSQLKQSLSTLKATDTSNFDQNKTSSLNTKISNLNIKIQEAQDAEEKAKKQIEQNKEKLETLKNEEQTLQEELNNLNIEKEELDNLICEKYSTVKDSLNTYNVSKKEFANYKSELEKSAKAELEKAQNKETEIKVAINNHENKEIKKEYSISPGSMYNKEEGERLVEEAHKMLKQYGSSKGLCATGVHRTFKMAYGISMGGHGYEWDSNMDKMVEMGKFVEVTGDYPTANDLYNLPAGAVICWENTGGKNGGGAQYGHVAITDGKGGEISDHHQGIITSVGGRNDQYRIFIPV